MLGIWKRLTGGRGRGAAVQTAAREVLAGWQDSVPLRGSEHRLYEQVRQSVPIIDAAIQKIVRLTGGFAVECADKLMERDLARFLERVRVGGTQTGIAAFLSGYLDDLLTYGNAAGEVVLSADGREIYALYNSPLGNLEVGTPHSPVEAEILIRDGMGLHPAPEPELLVFSALCPPSGEVRGVSLLRGLPFVGEILLRIYECIGKNFDRVGNVRFAVTYRPGEGGVDPMAAREIAQDIAKEWGEAMSAQTHGAVRDFVAVGDVDIKVIGADNQIIDTKVPVEQMLQQIVSKLGLPPFFLGLSWSTTERMSRQQADLLTSELEAYRRVLTPVILKICGLYLALCGQAADLNVNWDMINLQDAVEDAQARLLLAQAEDMGKDGVT